MTDSARRVARRDPHDEDVVEWEFDTRPGAGSLSRAQARRDVTVRQWDVVTPAATRIGRASGPDSDLSESVRRLHDETHGAMAGHSKRTHYLDRLRITQSLCNAVDLTGWERDRVLGVMSELDLTQFGSQRAIETVALVTIRHVTDVERRRYLGLDDMEFLRELDEADLERLYDRYRDHEITTDEAFERLLAAQDLTVTNLNRLRRTLKEQLDEETEFAAYGRNPNRDPALPTVRDDEREAEAGGSDTASGTSDAGPGDAAE